MSEYRPPNIERVFEHEQLIEYAENALEQLAPIFLGENTGELLDHLSVELRLTDQQGAIVPTARFDSISRKLAIIIEPETVLGYADDLADEINHGIETADIAHMLVGAGVARTILGWKTTGAGLHSAKTADLYKELICKKDYLWEEVSKYDDIYGTDLRRAVERLGDAQTLRVNWMRFSIGASLRHTSDIPQLQHSFVEHLRTELIEKENVRANDLHLNLGWLEADSAFALYDDNTPEIELAFSFPMSPAEEQRFLDY